ncbi:MAG: methionine aminotransferase, partial [Hydrogenophaga sp.]|nr:methionine aminotransferase [Hydrogenophaga sp.]
PMQHALAAYMADPAPYLNLPAFYQRKRDLPEADFCQWLPREVGVAAIPLSPFYGNGFDQKVVRFCFAKQDDTQREPLKRLARL